MKGSKPKPVIDPTGVPPEPPVHLNVAAREQWDYYANILGRKRILSQEDLAALTILATSMASYNHAQRQLDLDGYTTTGLHGGEVKSPWVTVQTASWNRIRPLLSEFGLTPTARGRLKSEPVEDEEFV